MASVIFYTPGVFLICVSNSVPLGIYRFDLVVVIPVKIWTCNDAVVVHHFQTVIDCVDFFITSGDEGDHGNAVMNALA